MVPFSSLFPSEHAGLQTATGYLRAVRLVLEVEDNHPCCGVLSIPGSQLQENTKALFDLQYTGEEAL